MNKYDQLTFLRIDDSAVRAIPDYLKNSNIGLTPK